MVHLFGRLCHSKTRLSILIKHGLNLLLFKLFKEMIIGWQIGDVRNRIMKCYFGWKVWNCKCVGMSFYVKLNPIWPGFLHCLKFQEGAEPPQKKISGTIEGSRMKLRTLKALLKATKIHKEIFRNLTYYITVTSLLK